MAAHLHPLLESLYATGVLGVPCDPPVQVTSHIPRDEAQLLYDVVDTTRANDALEVGMAFGVSSLALADALERRGARGKLVVMDPAQHDGTWRGLGLAHLATAGLAHRIEFHEQPSQAVLPELWQGGRRFQVAFVDGWHTFDHALIDCWYADRMLDIGGYLVLDDAGYPAIRRLIQFLMANWAYDLQHVLYAPAELGHHRLRRALKRCLGWLGRTDQTPSAEDARRIARLVGSHAVALRKRADDSRSFDHFRPF